MPKGKRQAIRSIDPNSGKTVGVYQSLAEAARSIGTKNVEKIRFSINSGWKTAFGLRWEKTNLCKEMSFQKEKINIKDVIKFLYNNQNHMSYKEIAMRTGYTVDELRFIYDTKKLYRAGCFVEGHGVVTDNEIIKALR